MSYRFQNADLSMYPKYPLKNFGKIAKHWSEKLMGESVTLSGLTGKIEWIWPEEIGHDCIIWVGTTAHMHAELTALVSSIYSTEEIKEIQDSIQADDTI